MICSWLYRGVVMFVLWGKGENCGGRWEEGGAANTLCLTVCLCLFVWRWRCISSQVAGMRRECGKSILRVRMAFQISSETFVCLLFLNWECECVVKRDQNCHN